ncbi:hypothetical protein ACFL96_18060 [Thermoproteota archaeon]
MRYKLFKSLFLGVFGIFICVFLISTAYATEIGESIGETLAGVNPENPNSLGTIVNETIALPVLLQEGLITQGEYDNYSSQLANLSQQWLNNTIGALDPDNYSFLPFMQIQWLLELVNDNPEDFEPWGWDEGTIVGGHEGIKKAASEWLKKRVDELNPNNPNFKPFFDMLVLQQVPELWDVKFDDESKAYKKEHFYDKLDQWLMKRADEMTTLSDLNNMSVFQDAFFEDEDYGKFSEEAKKYKEEKMRDKFATIISKEIKKSDENLDRIAEVCDRIVNDPAGEPKPEFSGLDVCDDLKQGNADAALEKLKPHKESFWQRVMNWLKKVFLVTPGPIEINIPEDITDHHDIPTDEGYDILDDYEYEVDESCNPNDVVDGTGQLHI